MKKLSAKNLREKIKENPLGVIKGKCHIDHTPLDNSWFTIFPATPTKSYFNRFLKANRLEIFFSFEDLPLGVLSLEVEMFKLVPTVGDHGLVMVINLQNRREEKPIIITMQFPGPWLNQEINHGYFSAQIDNEYQEYPTLEEVECEYIQKALEKHKGKQKDAALNLGISERTLSRKIKEYSIDISECR